MKEIPFEFILGGIGLSLLFWTIYPFIAGVIVFMIIFIISSLFGRYIRIKPKDKFKSLGG